MSAVSPLPSQVLTALLCGVSQYGVDNLVHQFTNCWRRLHWATEGNYPPHSATFQLLPGAGLPEAACIRELERKAGDPQDGDHVSCSNLPHYFTSSWTNNWLILNDNRWKGCVYQAFANGLRRYLSSCILNSKPGLGLFEAWNEIEDMIRARGGGAFGEVLGMRIRNPDEVTEEEFGMETGSSIGDLFGKGIRNPKDGAGEIQKDNLKGSTAGEMFGTGMEFDVLDVAISKKAAWCRAVHLLETIFLSKRVHIPQ